MVRAWLVFGIVAMTLGAGCSSSPDDASQGSDQTDPSSDEAELRGGELLSSSRVAALVREAGFPSNVVGRMVCTAKWESGFYTRSTNRNRNGTIDRGLFQINSIHLGNTPNCPASSSAIFDPLTNAKCARSIYKMQGINAWYGYRAHKSECDRTRAPAMPILPGSPGSPDDPIDTSLDQDLDTPEPLTPADMYGEDFGNEVVDPAAPRLAPSERAAGTPSVDP